MVYESINDNSPSFPSFKEKRYPLTALVLAATVVGGGLMAYKIRQLQSTTPKTTQKPQVKQSKITKVVALGKIEPQGETIQISPATSTQENRVEQLLVKEGQTVKAGQIIAVLNNKHRLRSALVKSQALVRVKRANLAKVLAGAKRGEIEAQKAQIARLKLQWAADKIAQQETIDRIQVQWEGDKFAQQANIAMLEAELDNARVECDRYEWLYSEGAISKSLLDSKRLKLKTTTQQLKEAKAVSTRLDNTSRKLFKEAKIVLNRINATSPQQINEAQANLEKIVEVRPVDIEIARAEVNDALADVNQAQKNLEQVYVRSPQDGQILDINTRPGEIISNDGIVEIGKTSQMYALAEVYQSDIKKVSPGQKVRITGDALDGELQGTVESVGLKVRRQNVINTDPSNNIDARVIEVHIRMDRVSSEKASKLTNLQVKTEIEI